MTIPVKEYTDSLMRIRQSEFEALYGYGFPPLFYLTIGMPGFAFIETQGNRFRIAEGEQGRPAIIFPVWDRLKHPVAIEPHEWHERLIDLMAWQPKHPDRWWLHDGCGPCLGATELAALHDPSELGSAWGVGVLGVFRNPLTWAKNLFRGIVILDWAMAGEVLYECSDFLVDDARIGTKIEKLRKPHIWVQNGASG